MIIKNAEEAYKKLTPAEFEDYIAEVFALSCGFPLQTKRTRDGGYDIRLSKDGLSYLIEVKKQAEHRKVGRPQLQALVGANTTQKADVLVFVTTSYFSRDAKQYAKEQNIILYDKDDVDHMITFANEMAYDQSHSFEIIDF